jgi:hypothetical protein
MARLVLEARTAEWTSGDVVRELLVGVSVSRADDGTPVSGLAAENFRVAAQFGDFSDFAVDEVREWEWEPGDAERAGCYQLAIGWATLCRHLWGQGHPLPVSGSKRAPLTSTDQAVSSTKAKRSLKRPARVSEKPMLAGAIWLHRANPAGTLKKSRSKAILPFAPGNAAVAGPQRRQGSEPQ